MNGGKYTGQNFVALAQRSGVAAVNVEYPCANIKVRIQDFRVQDQDCGRCRSGDVIFARRVATIEKRSIARMDLADTASTVTREGS
jgi:hypothetical protein